MRRFVGQKRYYYNLERKVDEFTLNLGEGSWYDMWHYHIDWPGHSNIGQSHRRKHLQLLFKVFTKILSQVDDYKGPFQTFIAIHEDGSQDAVYFHTPNPNKTDFPVKFEDISWSVEVPNLFKDLVPEGLEVGMADNEYGIIYYVHSLKHGIPI